jgi:CMP-2-keto-3-deoxyoctulosonic acid synthetase
MLDPSTREMDSNLEQLRALDNGMRIRAAVTSYESFSVDTQSDLDKVSRIMESSTVVLNQDIENE